MSQSGTDLPPELEMQSLLRQHWDESETSLPSAPSINTGEYRRGDTEVPVITITGGDEGPIMGSQTGYAAMDGSGLGGLQRIQGAVTVDCVAGSYDDLVRAGPEGTALNPKQIRWELYSHATQLMVDHQHSTGLDMISPGQANRIEEAFGSGDGVTYVFRVQFRAQYAYERRPRQT